MLVQSHHAGEHPIAKTRSNGADQSEPRGHTFGVLPTLQPDALSPALL